MRFEQVNFSTVPIKKKKKDITDREDLLLT